MHAVTKILVVFSAVLSVVLSALVIAFAINVGEIRVAYDKMDTERRAVTAALEEQQAQHLNERNSLTAELEAVRNASSDTEAEVARLRAERAQLLVQVQDVRSVRQLYETQITQLQGEKRATDELLTILRQEVVDLRKSLLQGSQREIQLVDRVNDLEGQVDVLEQSRRALEEQIAEIQVERDRIADGSAAGDIAIGPQIRCRVVSVFQSQTGETMVVLDEGENVGIREGAELNITRGTDFLAFVEITRVEPNQAVGRVNTLGQDVEIRANDLVLSRL